MPAFTDYVCSCFQTCLSFFLQGRRGGRSPCLGPVPWEGDSDYEPPDPTRSSPANFFIMQQFFFCKALVQNKKQQQEFMMYYKENGYPKSTNWFPKQEPTFLPASGVVGIAS